jgi:hypothetical protein
MADHTFDGFLTATCHHCDAVAVAFVRQPGSHTWETLCEHHTPWGESDVDIAPIDYHTGVPLPATHHHGPAAGSRGTDPQHHPATRPDPDRPRPDPDDDP